MTLSQARHSTIQDNDGGDQLIALVRGGHNVHRLLQHVCLLERRLQGGGEPTDLLLLVQDIKFAVEELHTLLQSAEQTIASPGASAVSATEGQDRRAPARRQRVELGPLLTHCVAAARQRLLGNSALSVRCHILSDLPVVMTDPETVTRIFSLLFEHALMMNEREEREVRVQWTKGTLVVEIDDAGRGIARETYAKLRELVEHVDGTFRVSHELGHQSRVELTFPSAATSGSAARQVVSLHPQGDGR